MEGQAAQEAFVRYQRTAEPAALAKVFDAVAPELLLVAAHLTRAPADAEDVVQQTFLAAIAHAQDFDPKRPLMPWLVAILARCAHRQREKSSRRVEPRDLNLPQPEDPHDAAAALEFAETIASRVAGLPAHYRIVLNLRLLHGLTPTEIAHATEVPLETVRTRLKRGLELLRQTLPAGFAGFLATFALSERGLAAVRATVLAHSSTVTAAGSVFAFIGGSMFMKTAVGFVATLVAAALMWIVWPRDAEPLVPAVSARTHSTVEATDPIEGKPETLAPPGRRGEALVAGSGTTDGQAEDAPAPSCGLRGRLLTAQRSPAAQCALRAISFDPAELFSGGMHASQASDSTPFEHSAIAGADGRFEITGLDARASFVLLAAPANLPVVIFRPECELRSGEVVDIGELVLGEGATITGRLFAEGQPVVGAQVRVAPDLPVSQEFGYRLSCLRPDLLHPDSAIMWDARGSSSGDGGLTVMELPAWVTPLWKSMGAPETVSDAEGRFRLSGVRAGAVVVTASKLGRFPKLVMPEVKPGATLDLGDLELFAAETVRGRVVGADGAPLANAEVLVGPRSLPGIDVHLLQRIGRTEAQGRFSIGGQAPREAFVAVRAQGERAWCASGPHGIGSELEIRIPKRFDLTVELRRGALEPADVRIAVRAGRPRGELLALGLAEALQTIDLRAGESRATVKGLFEGIYEVSASGGNSLDEHLSVELDSDRTVVLQLESARGVVVHVLDSSDKPLAGARVFARAAQEPAWMRSVLPEDSGIEHWSNLPLASARTDANGVARLSGLPATPLTLVASYPECSPRVLDVGAADRDVTLRLGPLGGLDLRIMRDGNPVEGSRSLEVLALGAESRAGLPIAPRRAATDARGMCSLRGLGAGRWRVSAYLPPNASSKEEEIVFSSSLDGSRSPKRRMRAVADVEILPGENVSLVMEESTARLAPGKPTISVHGRVKVNGLSRGDLVVGAFDFTRQAASGPIPMVKARTDSDGYYRIDGLGMPTESMQIQIQLRRADDDSMLAYEEIAIPPGASELEHNFNIAAGEVNGLVHDRAGRAVAKCSVHVSGHEGFGVSLHADTDAQGRFHFDLVPVGKINLQALTPGGNTVLDGLEVKSGPNPIDVTLLEYCRVAGRVNMSAIHAPAPNPIHVMIEMVDGPINYRPSSEVDRDTGRFDIQKVMAGDYNVRVWCNGTWWKHAEIVHVMPEEAESLAIEPVPDSGPTELGPSPESLTPGYPGATVGGF
ncbi:MAG TPA: sigma-70 family RNA polymerase sigma factor [Planctomycetota bacterium]|nr:sigma-70 family RNA polymerase sigma factor [Planctomycetota bacterium]